MMLINTETNCILCVFVVCTIQKALLKKVLDADHIKTCLRETFDMRRRTYLTPADGRWETTVNRMFADFPAFEKFDFVSVPFFAFFSITALLVAHTFWLLNFLVP